MYPHPLLAIPAKKYGVVGLLVRAVFPYNSDLDNNSSNYRLAAVYGKQGLVQDYSQRIEEGNIVRQKLSRLKLYRLRLHRHRPGWANGHGLRLYSLSLYGSETGGGEWGVQRNYILISFDS